ELAEAILSEGRADLIGMARSLLADPDWVRKVATGRADRIVHCVYGNICKNLDENFRKVVCVLWPKGSLQAPDSADAVAPSWTSGGLLEATESAGRVHLAWQPAVDNEEVYGYEIFRAEGSGPFAHVHSVRSLSFTDRGVTSGVPYRYFVRAYDLAGNRT